jgi:hypothetical protein
MWTILLVLALAGLIVVVSAPGNAVRTAQFQGGSVWVLPFHAIYQSMGAIIGSILVMFLVTRNNPIFPVQRRLAIAMAEKLAPLSKMERIVSLAMIMGVYCAVYAPSYWAQGTAPPNRTQIIFYILPLLLWIPWLALMLNFARMKSFFGSWLTSQRASVKFLSVIVLLAIALLLNIKNIALDAAWRAQQYDQQLRLRYDAIGRAKQAGETDLLVAPLQDVPKSMFFGDILSDPAHWRNQCYKNYFNIRSINITS